MSQAKGKERRRHERKDVLETFQVYVTIPKLGLRRLTLKDVSESGFAFFSDPADRLNSGDMLDSFFHINAGLKLPLKIKIAHTNLEVTGCEIQKTSEKAAKTYLHFIKLLDELVEFVQG